MLYYTSFLMKKISEKAYKDGMAAIGFVSLFGRNNTADIHNQVKDEFFRLQFGKYGHKAVKALRGSKKMINGAMEVAKTATQGNIAVASATTAVSTVLSYDLFGLFSVTNKIRLKEKEIPFAIVFDDFERCTGISPADRLGVINEYLESKRIKVYSDFYNENLS